MGEDVSVRPDQVSLGVLVDPLTTGGQPLRQVTAQAATAHRRSPNRAAQRVSVGQLMRRSVAVTARTIADIVDRDLERTRGVHDLHRPAVQRGKRRAERLVTAQNLAERALERREVRRCGEGNSQRHVVR